MKPLLIILLAIASLLAIAVGCYFAWPPAALIVPGALVWLDLTLTGLVRRVP